MTTRLALHGGAPAVARLKPHYQWPLITPAVEQVVVRQLHEDVAIYGRYGVFERFERQWAAYHGRQFALLTNSGTTGLWSMFVAAGFQQGDEVICPAYTFYATATPLFFTGASPVLCDSDESGNIDPAKVESLITERTKAVVVTHMWGIPCRMDELSRICKKHGLLLLEDCSHAHGARYRGQLVGTASDAAVWSLGGQKIITGGEGGIMVTDNPTMHERAVMLGHYNKRCFGEVTNPGLRRFAMTGMGLKLRASPMNVAMIEEQFTHLDEWLAQKRKFAALITSRITGLPGLAPPIVPDGGLPSWYSYVFRYKEAELGGLPVARFHEALLAEGCLETNRPTSTCPLNWLPLFQEPEGLFGNYRNARRYGEGDFPVAESFARQAITLPVWALATDEGIVLDYLNAIEKVVHQHKSLL